MKKILFAMAVLFGCATVSYAQTSFIATLQHEGELTHYYGAGALASAYYAANTGDIITLSPGTFTWTSGALFNKGITLRGAGIESENKTYISGEVTFVSKDSTMVTTVEGIRFNNKTYVQNNSSGSGQGVIKFIKNYFNQLTASKNSSTYSSNRGPLVRIYNSIVKSEMYFNEYVYPDFLFYNCYVENPYSYSYSTETTTAFVNCVINWTSTYASSAYYLNFYNCIFNWTCSSYGGSDYNNYCLPKTATCYNCVSINKTYLFSYLVSYGNNKTVGSASEVFATYTTMYPKIGETFELTDAAKEAYIGTDGTQIGMQGGNYPYTTTVQYPIITKFNVDAHTNKEGKLNVEVEVDGK